MRRAAGPCPSLDAPRGRGWSVFIEALRVPARIGIHPYEHEAPQPVVIDARLGYRSEPAERGASGYIDYDGYCARVASWLVHKPHTRLLETLVVELAALSFDEWPALESITLALHKPRIRPATRRVGVELDWTRADHAAWRAAAEARAQGLATAVLGGYAESVAHRGPATAPCGP